MSVESGMRNLLSNLGFTLLKAFPITNPTDMELVQRHRAAVQAKISGDEANVEAQLAHYAQTEALTLARIELENNVARAHARGQVNLELENELKDLRAQEARWNAELDFKRGEMEILVDEADAKTKRAMEMFAEVQARKAEELQTNRNSKNRMDSRTNCKGDYGICSTWRPNSEVKQECSDNKLPRKQSMVRKKIPVISPLR